MSVVNTGLCIFICVLFHKIRKPVIFEGNWGMSVALKQINLLEQGPVVEAEIYPSEESFLKSKNFGTPENFLKVRLLIDTGSNISGLDNEHIQLLNLQPYNDTEEWVHGTGGRWRVVRYGCVLYLPVFRTKALNIDVLEGSYKESNIDGVIGRDILRYCNFKYNGIANEFRLEAKGF